MRPTPRCSRADAANCTLGLPRCWRSSSPEQAETQPDLVAHHAAEAGLNEKAIDYWQRAGERGVARAAMKEAAARARQGSGTAGGLAPGTHPSSEGNSTCSSPSAPRSKPSRARCRPTQVERTPGRALLAEGLGRGEQLIQALLGQFYFHHGRTELDRAGELAAELLRASRQHGQITDVITAYDAVAGVAFSAGDFEKAKQPVRRGSGNRARDLATAFVSPKGTWRTGLLFTYAQTLAVLGYPDQASHLLRRGCRRGSDAAARLQPRRRLG